MSAGGTEPKGPTWEAIDCGLLCGSNVRGSVATDVVGGVFRSSDIGGVGWADCGVSEEELAELNRALGWYDCNRSKEARASRREVFDIRHSSGKDAIGVLSDRNRRRRFGEGS